MLRPHIAGKIAGWLLLPAMLVSCGIRLPVDTKHVQRVPVNLTTPPGKPPKDPDVLVWLIADDYHTGMVFPYDWLEESGFIPPAGFSKPRYVAMSWGSNPAYEPGGIPGGFAGTCKLLRIICAPTPSVMELIPANWNVPEVCPDQRIWRKLVSREYGHSLAAFLNSCSAKGPDGRPKVVRESSWGHGVQLEGKDTYYIPRVCNIWTAQAIESMGGRMSPWFGLTADGVIRQAEKPPNDFEQIWPGGGAPPKP